MDKVAKRIEEMAGGCVEAGAVKGGPLDGVRSVMTHEEAGIWGSTGLLVTMTDGTVYQVSITRLPGGAK